MSDREKDFIQKEKPLPEEEFSLESEDEEEELETGRKTSIVIKITAVIILLAFLAFSVPNFAYLLSDRLNFLNQSKELNQDEIVLNNRPAVVGIEVTSKDGKRSGTGFNIDPSGMIITNEHVVENADEITVEFSNGRKFYTQEFQEIQGVDVALIDIDGESLPAVAINLTDPVKTGEMVTVIGNPLQYKRVSQRGSIGEVSPVMNTRYHIFEIEIPINPGNSGSPVINSRSEVVGIVYAGVNMEEQNSGNSYALAVSVSDLPLD